MKYREHRPDHVHPPRSASRRDQAGPAIAPGKRTLTMGLASRAAAGAPPLQYKLHGGIATPTEAEGPPVDDWMRVAMRPDLHQTPIQRKSMHDIGYAGDEPQVAPPSTTGAPMPAAVQARMEHAFGADFSAVRVHQGDHVTAMGARAYAQGTDLHFAPGEYDPGSQGGAELLGHELAHVVQQAQGRVAPTTQAKGLAINDSSSLEREADEMGARAARGEVLPAADITAAPSPTVQGVFIAQGDPRRQRIKSAIKMSTKAGWDDTTMEELIDWATDVEQVIAFIETISHDDWKIVEEVHPDGVAHSTPGAITRLLEKSKARKNFSDSASTPDELLQDQLDRVLDARDRTAAAQQDLPLDRKSNYANASVFVDGRLLFGLVIPYESGRIPRDKKFQAAKQHLNTEDDPRIMDEEHATHGDSEVRLLQDLDKNLKQHQQAVTQAQSLVIQIVSSYGACDNCKDRLDDFLTEWQNARVEYHYYTKRERQSGRGRASAYGWSSDQKNVPVKTISNGSSYLYKHVIDKNDLDRRLAVKTLMEKPATPKATSVDSGPQNDNDTLASPKDTNVGTSEPRPDEQTTSPHVNSQPQPEVKLPYQISFTSKQRIDPKGRENAKKSLDRMLAGMAETLELTIENQVSEVQAGKLDVTITARVPAKNLHLFRSTIHATARKGLEYFVPINKKRETMMVLDFDHEIQEQ